MSGEQFAIWTTAYSKSDVGVFLVWKQWRTLKIDNKKRRGIRVRGQGEPGEPCPCPLTLTVYSFRVGGQRGERWRGRQGGEQGRRRQVVKGRGE